jgi:hypothetical protein
MTNDYQVVDRVSRETGKHLEGTDAVTAWDEEYEQVLVLEPIDDD